MAFDHLVIVPKRGQNRFGQLGFIPVDEHRPAVATNIIFEVALFRAGRGNGLDELEIMFFGWGDA